MKLQFFICWTWFFYVQAIGVLSLGTYLANSKLLGMDTTVSESLPQLLIADDIRLKPDGVNANPGWALDQIGEKFSLNTQVPIYSYPDTINPVRLYLIDTSVINPAAFLAANSNLKSLEIINLSGGDPVPRAHGTQMLSLIVGQSTGIATGTPIHVVNYDIYADSANATDPTTDVTSLAEAISEAVAHSRDPGTVPMRSVICIATSSESLGQRFAIDRAIDSAIAAGIPVVLSAGNMGANSAEFTPPSNGIKNGVICVGASDVANSIIPISNYGIPVDILAPGLEVQSQNGSGIVPMTGTSPATALVAGAILVKLSANPTFTPAGAESSLKAAAQPVAQSFSVLRSIVAPTTEFTPPDVVPDGPLVGVSNPIPLGSIPVPLAAFSVTSSSAPIQVSTPPATDSDADGMPDIVEIFHGSNSNVHPSSLLTLDAEQQIHFKFPIDQNLLDGTVSGNTFLLRNGYSWEIRCSSNFSEWIIPVGRLSKHTDVTGQAWLTASFPAGNYPSCFARIQILAPAAP